MICPKCGKINTVTASICSDCGTSLNLSDSEGTKADERKIENKQEVKPTLEPSKEEAQVGQTQTPGEVKQTNTTPVPKVDTNIQPTNPTSHPPSVPGKTPKPEQSPAPQQPPPTQPQEHQQPITQTPMQPQQAQPLPQTAMPMNPPIMQQPLQPPFQQGYQLPQQEPFQAPQDQMQQMQAQQQQITKPTSGLCSVCNRNNLVFFDNGMGKCLYCGRTFDWLNPRRKRLAEKRRKKQREENPFMVKEDEILDESERKAEVEADDVIYHDAGASSIIAKGKDKAKDKPKDEDEDKKPKSDAGDKEGLTDEKRLELLEDRLISGEISEETYKKLHDKFRTKILDSLEDRLVTGEITEEKYNKLKQKYE